MIRIIELCHQMAEMEREYSAERDDLENHLEQLKSQLQTAQERSSNLQDTVSPDVAALLQDKDDIISQLEEKVIENDRKMVDMQVCSIYYLKNDDLYYMTLIIQNC